MKSEKMRKQVKSKKRQQRMYIRGLFLKNDVGLPRFELGQTEPKPVVLPLHHSPNLWAFC